MSQPVRRSRRIKKLYSRTINDTISNNSDDNDEEDLFELNFSEEDEGILSDDSFIVNDIPDDCFIKQGYRATEKTSTVIKAIEWGSIKAPKLFVNLFLRTLSQGYAVYVFEFN